MTAGVIKFEEILKPEKNLPIEKKKSKPSKKKKKKSKAEKKDVIPKGVPVSGRVWKNEKKRFSSVIKTRGYKAANKFEKLLAVKQEINRMRDLSRAIVEEKRKKIEELRERKKRNKERKEANQLKAEIVQVIKNPAKIKRMKKKQLRSIKKRDTLNVQN